jgi:U3 small nucleolar RNA-associated protein 23
MRITRHKALKKSLRFYKAAFDYVDPFHVVTHPSFIDLAVKGSINLKDDLSKVLAGRVTPMITECTMAYLRKNGRTNTPALLVGKSCYRLKCGHEQKSPLTPDDCILSQLGKENVRHFFIAAQDGELVWAARKIPGTPVLSIHGNLLMLEPPSEESRVSAQHREEKRRLPKLSEKHEGGDSSDSDDGTSSEKKRKKRRTKGKNPLSCRPKKIKLPDLPAPTIEKKKRVRSRGPKPSHLVIE